MQELDVDSFGIVNRGLRRKQCAVYLHFLRAAFFSISFICGMGIYLSHTLRKRRGIKMKK